MLAINKALSFGIVHPDLYLPYKDQEGLQYISKIENEAVKALAVSYLHQSIKKPQTIINAAPLRNDHLDACSCLHLLLSWFI